MYLLDLFASLMRRWPLTVLALLMTIGGGAAVAHVVPAQYEAKSSLVLLPPKSSEFPGENRYLMLSDLGQASGVVIRALNGDETHQAVAADLTGGGTFSVAPDYTTNAPILIITATSPTSQQAAALLRDVEAQVPDVLKRLQAAAMIKTDAQINAVHLTTSEQPTKVIKKQLRAVVAAGVLLLVVLMASVGAIDGMLLRRAETRATRKREKGPRKKAAAEYDDDPAVLLAHASRPSIPPKKTRADVH